MSKDMGSHILICRNLENFVTSYEGEFNAKPSREELIDVITKNYLSSDYLANRFTPDAFGALLDSVPYCVDEILSESVGFTDSGMGFNFHEWVLLEKGGK